MTKLKCIAIDDEPLALQLITANIERIPFLKCEGAFNSAVKAEEFLKKNKTDLIFLDIQMPALSGMELARTVSESDIIFTTAFDHYAIEGFEVEAIDYLLKPITFPRFEKACLKAKERFELRLMSQPEQSIIIRSEHRNIKLPISDIIYIEGLKDYVKIFVENSDKPILTRTNLKGMHDQLPKATFFRVHKSYVVNFNKVYGLESDSLLLNNIRIPLGEVYRPEIRKRFGV